MKCGKEEFNCGRNQMGRRSVGIPLNQPQRCIVLKPGPTTLGLAQGKHPSPSNPQTSSSSSSLVFSALLRCNMMKSIQCVQIAPPQVRFSFYSFNLMFSDVHRFFFVFCFAFSLLRLHTFDLSDHSSTGTCESASHRLDSSSGSLRRWIFCGL